MKLVAALSTFALVCSSQVFAGPSLTAHQDLTSDNQISYEEAVSKCQEFVNDPQLVVIKFKVSCFSEDFQWQETDRRTIDHANSASVGHRIIMKEKWHTPDFAIPKVKAVSHAQCPILTKFRTTKQVELVVSCNELVEQYKDAELLAHKCDQMLENAIPQTEPTGSVVDPCKSGK